MPLGDRIRRRRHGRRLIRYGETFTPTELDLGEIELETVDPAPEPDEDGQVEPWAWGDKDMPEHVRARLAEYRRQFPEGGDGSGDH